MASLEGRTRAVIAAVSPMIDAGRFPIKRIAGESVTVEADIFTDGHDALRALLLDRREGTSGWRETPMTGLVNDRWRAEFHVQEPGRHFYTIEAWVDHFRSWRRDMAKKIAAGEDRPVDYLVGAALIEAAAERAPEADAARLREWKTRLTAPEAKGDPQRRAAVDEELALLVDRHPDRSRSTRFDRELAVVVDRERARFAAWYEFFPRSCTGDAARHGTFRDCQARIEYAASMGFDVIYLPPVHPIGRTSRKGKNNSTVALPGDVGSPWAIGAAEGGHTAVHPDLGTLADFDALVAKAKSHGIEVALDIAFQCSPDHPAVAAHPDWFSRRPDGSLQYAENPPKRYEDIYPFNFESAEWRALWEELKGVFLFWIGHGVRIFRVDNPHTKPFPFWEWVIGEIKREFPETIFLAEAFTRPKVMNRLAKIGFSQSYTYFSWRNSRFELEQYFTELTRTEVAEYFRPNLWPNTPDILTEFLQHGGRPAFQIRLILAATLGASYGIYGPAFELCESTPRESGCEEYLDSEKFQIRTWDLDAPGSLRSLIAHVNRIRRQNPALHRDGSLRFHPAGNDQILCYSKHSEDFGNIILVAVNLDPHHVQQGEVELNFDELDLQEGTTYQMHDLLTDTRSLWQGRKNPIQLDPGFLPAAVFVLRRRVRSERDFDYYM